VFECFGDLFGRELKFEQRFAELFTSVYCLPKPSVPDIAALLDAVDADWTGTFVVPENQVVIAASYSNDVEE
jgi:hypothetical protein